MYFSPDLGLTEQEPSHGEPFGTSPSVSMPQPPSIPAANSYFGAIAAAPAPVTACNSSVQATGPLQPSVSMDVHPPVMQSYAVAQPWQPNAGYMMVEQSSLNTNGSSQKRGSPSCDGGDSQKGNKRAARGAHRTPASTKKYPYVSAFIIVVSVTSAVRQAIKATISPDCRVVLHRRGSEMGAGPWLSHV